MASNDVRVVLGVDERAVAVPKSQKMQPYLKIGRERASFRLLNAHPTRVKRTKRTQRRVQPKMVSMLQFIQINLHKASAAVVVLSRRIVAEQVEISLIQEPWTYRVKVRGLNIGGGKLHYCTSVDRLRICILVRGVRATHHYFFLSPKEEKRDSGCNSLYTLRLSRTTTTGENRMTCGRLQEETKGTRHWMRCELLLHGVGQHEHQPMR